MIVFGFSMIIVVMSTTQKVENEYSQHRYRDMCRMIVNPPAQKFYSVIYDNQSAVTADYPREIVSEHYDQNSKISDGGAKFFRNCYEITFDDFDEPLTIWKIEKNHLSNYNCKPTIIRNETTHTSNPHSYYAKTNESCNQSQKISGDHKLKKDISSSSYDNQVKRKKNHELTQMNRVEYTLPGRCGTVKYHLIDTTEDLPEDCDFHLNEADRSFEIMNLERSNTYTQSKETLRSYYDSFHGRISRLQDADIIFFLGSFYDDFKFINSGSYGKVYSARNKEKGTKIAVKVLFNTLTLEVEDMNEIKALCSLNHINIISASEIIRYRRLVFIPMDFVDTTLLEFIKKFDVLKELLSQTVCGVRYLHLNGIIHRDLKPENILVTSDGVVKITDFGMCSINLKNPDTNRGHLGTLEYKAPELFDRKGFHTYTSDIYSLGIIIFEMLTDKFLISCDNSDDFAYKQYRILKNKDFLHRIIKSKISNYGIVCMIADCCKLDPDHRMRLIDLEKKIHDIDFEQFV